MSLYSIMSLMWCTKSTNRMNSQWSNRVIQFTIEDLGRIRILNNKLVCSQMAWRDRKDIRTLLVLSYYESSRGSTSTQSLVARSYATRVFNSSRDAIHLFTSISQVANDRQVGRVEPSNLLIFLSSVLSVSCTNSFLSSALPPSFPAFASFTTGYCVVGTRVSPVHIFVMNRKKITILDTLIALFSSAAEARRIKNFSITVHQIKCIVWVASGLLSLGVWIVNTLKSSLLYITITYLLLQLFDHFRRPIPIRYYSRKSVFVDFWLLSSFREQL